MQTESKADEAHKVIKWIKFCKYQDLTVVAVEVDVSSLLLL